MEYIINITGFILKGFSLTAKIYASTLLFALPLGVLAAIGKTSGPKWLRSLLGIYTWLGRGTPLLLLLFIMVFGLPTIGIRLPDFMAASIAYVITYGALLTEIFRAGIESIDKGQYEAAQALGMNYFQTMRRVIIPQTIRRVLPATSSEAINLVKDTPLLAAIGMPDLLRNAKQVFTRDYNVSSFIVVFVLYLLLSSLMVKFFSRMEAKYSIYE